jgi:archaellum component FlaF (FlaF/FlaG flagellin family)
MDWTVNKAHQVHEAALKQSVLSLLDTPNLHKLHNAQLVQFLFGVDTLYFIPLETITTTHKTLDDPVRVLKNLAPFLALSVVPTKSADTLAEMLNLTG